MPEAIQETAAYSVAQVAELLGYEKHLVYDAVRRGELRAFTPNGCKRGMRVMGAWVLEWINGATRGQG